jgi:hypothetical protein
MKEENNENDDDDTVLLQVRRFWIKFLSLFSKVLASASSGSILYMPRV